MHGQVFLYLNNNTASMKSDSSNTSGQSRLSPVAPVVHRTTVKDELEQGSGVVVPLVLARHALHVAQNFNDTNTQNQKQCKLSLILLTTETKKKHKALTMLCGNTQAMTRLYGNQKEIQSNDDTLRKYTSNDETLRENTQSDGVRHNQHD